jgi:hypothetical protein
VCNICLSLLSRNFWLSAGQAIQFQTSWKTKAGVSVFFFQLVISHLSSVHITSDGSVLQVRLHFTSPGCPKSRISLCTNIHTYLTLQRILHFFLCLRIASSVCPFVRIDGLYWLLCRWTVVVISVSHCIKENEYLFRPVRVAAPSEARTVFSRSNTGIVVSIPTRGMDMSAFFCVVLSYVGRGLASA